MNASFTAEVKVRWFMCEHKIGFALANLASLVRISETCTGDWRSTVYKAILLLPRRKDLSHRAFMEYWVKHNQPLARKVPGVARFEWFEALISPDGEPPVDGVVELWFDSLQDVQTAIQSPEAKEAEADLVNFVDYSRYTVFLTKVGGDQDGATASPPHLSANPS
jgi:uncharacterized protein (TIGR02118 family)